MKSMKTYTVMLPTGCLKKRSEKYSALCFQQYESYKNGCYMAGERDTPVRFE